MAKFEHLYKVNYPTLNLYRILFQKRFSDGFDEITTFGTCPIHAISRCAALGYDKHNFNVLSVEKLEINEFFTIVIYQP